MALRLAVVLVCLLPALPLAAETPGVRLGELSWPVAAERLRSAPVVILPFAAAAKEHGPHLPLNADAVVLDWLLDEAIAAEPVVVVPPVLHGWMPAFREFPGTGVADPTAFQLYIMQISESLLRHGVKRLVFLNTGISKASGLPISIVAREIRTRHGVPTLVVSWDDLETEAVAALASQASGGHGDEIETSIQLYLQPARVNLSLAVKDYGALPIQEYAGYRPGLFSRRPEDPAYSESGIRGDPTLATAEKGRKALALMREEWLRALRGFATTPRTRNP